MKVSTLKQFYEIDKRKRNWVASNRTEKDLDDHDKGISEREKRKKKFKDSLLLPLPFTAVVEGVYPEQDYANRWCWRNIGPRQCDKCDCSSSEYPGCPVVLATEYIKTGWYPNQAGQRVYWSEKAYIEENVLEHGHEGIWSSYWLGKTGYDYGFTEYYFQNESDRDRFLAAVPFFNTGEKYEEKDMSTMTEKAVHQSKWGFHPVSREASKKLRFINAVYAKAQHLAGAWERWERKIPSNRVIRRSIRDSKGLKIGMEVVKDEAGNPVLWKEPQVCPLFHVTIPGTTSKWSRTDGRAEDNGFGDKILFASRQARIPQPTPADVLPFPFTEQEIDSLYETAKEWMDNR